MTKQYKNLTTFQSSLWSYCLCYTNEFLGFDTETYNFNLLYEAIVCATLGMFIQSKLITKDFNLLYEAIVCATKHRIEYTRIKLRFQSSLWSYCLCYMIIRFMFIICLQRFNLLYEANFFATNIGKQSLEGLDIPFQSSLWS